MSDLHRNQMIFNAAAAHTNDVMARTVKNGCYELARCDVEQAFEAGANWALTVRDAVADADPSIADQPPPIAVSRRPAWDIVIEHTKKRLEANAYGTTGVVDLVLADMRERDQVGRARYGTPLTAGSGRDHLVDAYQECLDLAAYLAAELDEHGVTPATYTLFPGRRETNGDQQFGWYLHCVQQVFAQTIHNLITIRALILDRPR